MALALCLPCNQSDDNGCSVTSCTLIRERKTTNKPNRSSSSSSSNPSITRGSSLYSIVLHGIVRLMAAPKAKTFIMSSKPQITSIRESWRDRKKKEISTNEELLHHIHFDETEDKNMMGQNFPFQLCLR